jgi:hypothetical protein
MNDPAGRLDYPEKLRAEIARLGGATVEALDDNPGQAKEAALGQLDLIERAERNEGRSLHKGQPFHNLGLIEARRDGEAARTWFLAAHLEDGRSFTQFDPRRLAAQVLSSVYGYSENGLGAMSERARSDADVKAVQLATLIVSEARVCPGEGSARC